MENDKKFRIWNKDTYSCVETGCGIGITGICGREILIVKQSEYTEMSDDVWEALVNSVTNSDCEKYTLDELSALADKYSELRKKRG